VFANFSFQKEKFIKENTVLLVKLFFPRKGLQSHTLCRGREGKPKSGKKRKRFRGGRFFLSPFYFYLSE